MKRPMPPLCATDRAALAAITSSGAAGMSAKDIHVVLDAPADREAVQKFVKRARDRGHRIKAVRVALNRGVHVYRYSIEDSGTVEAASLRSVTRIVSGDIGLGATPGTPVSVPYVSFIDAISPSAMAAGL